MVLNQRLVASCAPARALAACQDYLTHKQASVEAMGLMSIRAHCPLVMLSIDRRLYSRENIIGLNPLAFVGAIDIEARETGIGTTLQIGLSPAPHIFIFPYFSLILVVLLCFSDVPLFMCIFAVSALVGYIGLAVWLLTVGFRHELRSHIQNML